MLMQPCHAADGRMLLDVEAPGALRVCGRAVTGTHWPRSPAAAKAAAAAVRPPHLVCAARVERQRAADRRRGRQPQQPAPQAARQRQLADGGCVAVSLSLDRQAGDVNVDGHLSMQTASKALSGAVWQAATAGLQACSRAGMTTQTTPSQEQTPACLCMRMRARTQRPRAHAAPAGLRAPAPPCRRQWAAAAEGLPP